MSVSSIAKGWVGRNFEPGVAEQCMAFVRRCLRQANHTLQSKVTNAPVDGLPTNPMLASSLAGRDLGCPLTDAIAEFKPGTIVFFQDTYAPPPGETWPPGTITHVGIYIGSGNFVHRPTMSRPVEQASLASGYWYNALRCGLVIQDGTEVKPVEPIVPEVYQVRIWAHNGKHTLKAMAPFEAGTSYEFAGLSPCEGDGVELRFTRKAASAKPESKVA